MRNSKEEKLKRFPQGNLAHEGEGAIFLTREKSII
jgi:hypothetical protein